MWTYAHAADRRAQAGLSGDGRLRGYPVFAFHGTPGCHEAGDALLVAFADAIRWSVRKEDMAFCIGGDEFLLMLVDADRAQAEQVLDRLRDRWAEAGNPVGFSAGIASGEQDVMRLADDHTYANKRSRDLPAD